MCLSDGWNIVLSISQLHLSKAADPFEWNTFVESILNGPLPDVIIFDDVNFWEMLLSGIFPHVSNDVSGLVKRALGEVLREQQPTAHFRANADFLYALQVAADQIKNVKFIWTATHHLSLKRLAEENRIRGSPQFVTWRLPIFVTMPLMIDFLSTTFGNQTIEKIRCELVELLTHYNNSRPLLFYWGFMSQVFQQLKRANTRIVTAKDLLKVFKEADETAWKILLSKFQERKERFLMDLKCGYGNQLDLPGLLSYNHYLNNDILVLSNERKNAINCGLGFLTNHTKELTLKVSLAEPLVQSLLRKLITPDNLEQYLLQHFLSAEEDQRGLSEVVLGWLVLKATFVPAIWSFGDLIVNSAGEFWSSFSSAKPLATSAGILSSFPELHCNKLNQPDKFLLELLNSKDKIIFPPIQMGPDILFWVKRESDEVLCVGQVKTEMCDARSFNRSIKYLKWDSFWTQKTRLAQYWQKIASSNRPSAYIRILFFTRGFHSQVINEVVKYNQNTSFPILLLSGESFRRNKKITGPLKKLFNEPVFHASSREENELQTQLQVDPFPSPDTPSSSAQASPPLPRKRYKHPTENQAKVL